MPIWEKCSSVSFFPKLSENVHLSEPSELIITVRSFQLKLFGQVNLIELFKYVKSLCWNCSELSICQNLNIYKKWIPNPAGRCKCDARRAPRFASGNLRIYGILPPCCCRCCPADVAKCRLPNWLIKFLWGIVGNVIMWYNMLIM